jgi:signal peptidase I
MNTKKKSSLREWIESAVVALILALFIRTFIVQAFKIPTGSMRPTLLEGDAILVNKFLLGTPVEIPFTDITLFNMPGFAKPQRGDVIVFKYPEDTKKDFIKRLVAKGGETVEIRNGTIYVDEKPITGPDFDGRYYYNRGDFGEANQKVTVPQGSYFVLGDNSFSSQDSRYWGFVPEKNIRGKAMVIYWPPMRLRVIK